MSKKQTDNQDIRAPEEINISPSTTLRPTSKLPVTPRKPTKVNFSEEGMVEKDEELLREFIEEVLRKAREEAVNSPDLYRGLISASDKVDLNTKIIGKPIDLENDDY